MDRQTDRQTDGELINLYISNTDFVFNIRLLILVQVYFDKSGSIQLDPDSLANNFRGKRQILQNSIMDSSKCTTASKREVNQTEFC